jgi:hypothetical protein
LKLDGLCDGRINMRHQSQGRGTDFPFGSRDVWLVVGLLVFLYSQGRRYMEVASFIAS